MSDHKFVEVEQQLSKGFYAHPETYEVRLEDNDD